MRGAECMIRIGILERKVLLDVYHGNVPWVIVVCARVWLEGTTVLFKAAILPL
jgi:hypothetical protein